MKEVEEEEKKVKKNKEIRRAKIGKRMTNEEEVASGRGEGREKWKPQIFSFV